MRGAARWLLVLAILAIVGWLGFTYRTQRRALADQAPTKPDMLPLNVSGKAEDWHWVKTDEKNRKIVEIWASNFKQEKNTNRLELEQVRLNLFHKEGDQFDRVESPFAIFQPNED